jgi:hypothetical protein
MGTDLHLILPWNPAGWFLRIGGRSGLVYSIVVGISLLDRDDLFGNLDWWQEIAIGVFYAAILAVWLRAIRIPWKVDVYADNRIQIRGPFLRVDATLQNVSIEPDRSKPGVTWIDVRGRGIPIASSMAGFEEFLDRIRSISIDAGKARAVTRPCLPEKDAETV